MEEEAPEADSVAAEALEEASAAADLEAAVLVEAGNRFFK